MTTQQTTYTLIDMDADDRRFLITPPQGDTITIVRGVRGAAGVKTRSVRVSAWHDGIEIMALVIAPVEGEPFTMGGRVRRPYEYPPEEAITERVLRCAERLALAAAQHADMATTIRRMVAQRGHNVRQDTTLANAYGQEIYRVALLPMTDVEIAAALRFEAWPGRYDHLRSASQVLEFAHDAALPCRESEWSSGIGGDDGRRYIVLASQLATTA